jgi:hypothetical protein
MVLLGQQVHHLSDTRAANLAGMGSTGSPSTAYGGEHQVMDLLFNQSEVYNGSSWSETISILILLDMQKYLDQEHPSTDVIVYGGNTTSPSGTESCKQNLGMVLAGLK